MRFQRGIKASVVTILKAICNNLAKYPASTCPCPEILIRVDFKENKLIFLAKEISSQESIPAGSAKAVLIGKEIISRGREVPCYALGQKHRNPWSKTPPLTGFTLWSLISFKGRKSKLKESPVSKTTT